ncbi:stage III sporulation protein AE [Clostridium sp. CM028]|uniref:stage III sporulation protein AE n=1 Tax=unclassified Clostridium TaxID=2614128 RepID=UPI001C0D4767|nr:MULTISPECIES: stage III sporulation protein AE [unclassified Clostridium]MBU3091549.1 stage III sporulation protein AE [Clostridium sp. CF011]MBW9144187.1 stage III sporulation protein AE [Clostridium sp. CM027]MBW9147503.1 stage III sporulation protein AE [Clostridium sp. CM028]UVE42574.1 stage III sporulation protein AE [Clostridium sp. CM027]WAG71527.1 stage III sporulation protein AE [Clostridium sp. CF011]
MKKIIIILLFLICLPISVQATQPGKLGEKEEKEISNLYDYITNIKTKYEIFNDMDPRTFVEQFIKTGENGFSFKETSNYVIRFTFKEVVASMELIGSLMIIAVICALLNNLQSAFNKEGLSNIAYFACYGVMIVMITKSFYIVAELAKSTILNMTDFMAALMPVLMMLLASVGGFAEATLLDPIIMGFATLSSRIYVDMIIPIIFMSFVLQFVKNISSDYKINNLTKLFKQIAIWSQGIVMTVFIAVITLRSIAAKTIDQVTIKTAKFAVDNFIPVVGKCLSDAISTVAGYSLLLKNAISGLGLVIIIVIVLFPIIKLLIMAFLYKVAAALIEPISDSRTVDCMNSVGDSILLLMSCVISVSVMFFIMVAIVASTGKGIIS